MFLLAQRLRRLLLLAQRHQSLFLLAQRPQHMFLLDIRPRCMLAIHLIYLPAFRLQLQLAFQLQFLLAIRLQRLLLLVIRLRRFLLLDNPLLFHQARHLQLRPAVIITQLLTFTRRLLRTIRPGLEASLSWSTDHPDLPDNYSVALSRFQTLDRSLKRNPVKAKVYESTIEDYISQTHARKLEDSEFKALSDSHGIYPHHPLFNPSKPRKCCVVFDGAASFRGVSLNPETSNFAISGDINGMFHQVRVRQCDTHALRFLWRSPNLAPRCLRDASPNRSRFFTHRLLHRPPSEFLGLVEKFERNCYMDNYMDWLDTEEETIEFSNKIQDGLGKSRFLWTEWMSTSRTFLQSIRAICDPTRILI